MNLLRLFRDEHGLGEKEKTGGIYISDGVRQSCEIELSAVGLVSVCLCVYALCLRLLFNVFVFQFHSSPLFFFTRVILCLFHMLTGNGCPHGAPPHHPTGRNAARSESQSKDPLPPPPCFNHRWAAPCPRLLLLL